MVDNILGSIYYEGNVDELKKGSRLYNAIGTSNDKIVYRGKEYTPSMVHTWETLSGQSKEQIGEVCVNQNCVARTYEMKKDLVGAHVTTADLGRNIQSGDIVYLIPLCRSCNSTRKRLDIILRCDVLSPAMEWQ
jgi:hypothetical protein